MLSFPSLTLTYFDFTGRAEAIRKTLTMGGVPFVDRRVSSAELQQLKPSFPYGKMPVLEVDGRVYAETQGLLRYAARLGGLYPPPYESVAAALVDEILSTFEDFFDRLLAPSFEEKDPAIVKTLREHAVAGPLPHALRLIDTRLEQIASHAFFTANKARVYVHEVLVWDYVVFLRSGQLDHVPTTLIDGYKTMIAVHDKVIALASTQAPHPQAQASARAERPLPEGTLKLTYFDVAARAEPIRLALHMGGIAFDDERLSREAFDSQKHLFPNEEVPVLSLDGHVVAAQSFALLRYAGRITGLYPYDDLLTALQIDEVLGHLTELDTVLYLCFHEPDAEKKRVSFTTILKQTIPESLGSLDTRVRHWNAQNRDDGNPSMFAVGGATMTIADLAIYNLLLDLTTTIVDEDDLVPYEALKRVYDNVATHPRVSDWYAATKVLTASDETTARE